VTLRGLWSAWVAFWDRREGPESLALARILVGGVLVGDFLDMLAEGFVPDLWLAPSRGLGWAADGSSGFLHTLATSGAGVSVVWLIGTLGALGVLAGAWLCPAALACVGATLLLARLAPDGDRAIDALLRVVLIVFACSKADAAWSLRAVLERRRGRQPPTIIPAWPRQLLFAQLIWVYFSAAQNRGGVGWWPSGGFVALSHVLSDPHFARFSPGWTAALEPLPRIGTALTMLFELGSPLIVVFTWLERDTTRQGAFARAVRRLHLRFVWLGLGASLHIGIALTMRLGIFPYGMLALYPLLFVPDETRAFVERVRRLSAKANPSAAQAPG
jgi:hypothetical protein